MPGAVAGYMASQGAGFLGGLIGGFIAGYSVNFLKENDKEYVKTIWWYEINGNISNIQFSDNWCVDVFHNRSYIYKDKCYSC